MSTTALQGQQWTLDIKKGFIISATASQTGDFEGILSAPREATEIIRARTWNGRR